ncbi:MAG: 6-carboxytetrahydropterin synthase [Bryobacteraceae bacterium]|jgi:6-pyruvoyltetrahydropterin/6-carboxytetrahydropterin synthase
MFRLTRRYRFSASHRLHSAALSAEENRRLYGKCNNPFGHGHNYVVEVSARGPADDGTGTAVNPAVLDALVDRHVIAAFDHRDLSSEIERFQDLPPTSENVAVEICRRLKTHWPEAFPGAWPKLEKIRIAETDRNIFEVNADEIS